MCSRHEQLPHVIGIGLQWATTHVRQKATVACELRASRSNKRLMYEPSDLEHNSLTAAEASDARISSPKSAETATETDKHT